MLAFHRVISYAGPAVGAPETPEAEVIAAVAVLNLSGLSPRELNLSGLNPRELNLSAQAGLDTPTLTPRR